MVYLLLASLLWAFSFGLIKRVLAGLDPFFVAWVRLALSFLLFLPFARPAGRPRGVTRRLAVVGAVQYGLMYTCYIASYQLLAGHQVALFTVFTPLYVVWMNDIHERRFNGRNLMGAALAVAGAAVVVHSGQDWRSALGGFALVQASNIAFGFGQLAYRRALAGDAGGESGGTLRDDIGVHWVLYLGGLLAASAPVLVFTDWGALRISPAQAGALLYLGLLPSGLAFFLWNAGARRVGAGPLAVLNNLKIPLAVAVAVLVFREKVDLAALLAGGGLMAVGLGICSRRKR
jgi:drug/metabolite transporter (DMT)-like permease